jgi:LPXTG-motif cell wall-anchored protein
MYGNTAAGVAGAGATAGVAGVDPGALPHTGLQLIWLVLVAVMLIAVGLSARRLVRRNVA